MLFRKFLRDLINNKVQFISIFIMAALSTYIYVGMGSLYNGLDKELDSYYEKTNFMDYAVVCSDGIKDEDLEKIKSLEHVSEVEKRVVINDAIATDYDNSTMVVNVVNSNYKISKCVVIEGNDIDSSEDSIWLDYRYAKEHRINVGDVFRLNILGEDIECTIKGLVINPEYIYQVNADNVIPNHKDMGFVFLTQNSYNHMDKANQILVDMESTQNTKNDREIDGKKDIKNLLGVKERDAYYKLKEADIEAKLDNYDIFTTREDVTGHMMFNQAIEQYRAIGIVFPIAFLAVTVLTMLTTITRLVDKQRVQIGTLGTMGLKKNKIYRHYIAFGFYPALVGCLVGLISAPYTLPQTFYGALDSLYTMERWKSIMPISSVVIVVICIGLCVGVTCVTIGKVLKETPAQAIKPKVSKELDNSKILESDFIASMRFGVKWNLIDLLKGKVRAIMTIVGIAGCMGLLLAGFGFRDALSNVVEDQYEKMYTFNSKILLDMNKMAIDSDDILKNEIKSNYKNAEFIYEGSIDVSNKQKRKLTNMIVASSLDNIAYYSEDNKKVELPKEGANISRKIANYLDVKKGDIIRIKLLGTKEYKDVKVSDIYVSPITQGIVISKKYYEEIGYDYMSNYVLTSDKVSLKSGDAKSDGIIKSITKEKLKSDYEFTKKTLDSISYILMGSAILLAIVVLYNLNMLSLYEKESEFALLKVLGFKSSRIRNLLLSQTIVLVIIGLIIGIPFGMGLLYVILNTMGENVDMILKISSISWIISILLTCGISIIMNLLFIFKIKQIDMVSSLKTIE